eukprot:6421478-Prymnesium_polylepis.1
MAHRVRAPARRRHRRAPAERRGGVLRHRGGQLHARIQGRARRAHGAGAPAERGARSFRRSPLFRLLQA